MIISIIVVCILLLVFGVGVTVFLLTNDIKNRNRNSFETFGVKGAVRAMDRDKIITFSDIEKLRRKLPKF